MSKKSKFDLSHERKLSFNMGELIPIFLQDVLPGDKFRVNSEILLRMAPMLAPIMHRVNVFTHFFYVPNRLVWNEWQDFITGGREGDLAPIHPFLTFPNAAAPDRTENGSLADYFGLPTYPAADVPTFTNDTKISALPFRAYQLIYNEFYRDQNLTDPIPFGLASGPVNGADLLAITLKRQRAWEKDYFTSSLPWAQRGGAAMAPLDYTQGIPSSLRDASSNAALPNQTNLQSEASGLIQGVPGGNARIETAGGIEINELRKANKVQEWLERNARSGARYIEVLLGQFGVKSSDMRLQRPEYLGGGRTPVVISEVLSTFQADAGVAPYPQGNMSGHGIAVGSTHGFSRRFEEHGHVIGIMSVLPKSSYQQGVNKMFTRFDKFEYPWPVFANLGEQEVSSHEIFFDPTKPANTPPTTFGYQERYAECKYGYSTVHGNFRDNLAFWHMGRIFATEPVLNESFVMSDPTTRIFAVEAADEHHMYAQIYNAVSALRPLPFFGTPRL